MPDAYSELEREKTSQRTREHLMTKARRGLNVGGRVYGYENVEIKDGDRRVRVEYRIHAGQADIIREIFRRYAAGEGLRTIAKELNARGVPAPRAGKRGIGSWCVGSLKPMLQRDRYRGVIVWGKKEKTYRKGTKVRVSRPEEEWIRVEAAELRIVDEELWNAAQARAGQKKSYGRERTSGAVPRYLLSGFSRCGACGGRIQVINGKAGKAPIKVYVCANHRERGTCANATRRPVEQVDAAVLGWIQEHVTTEEVVGEVVREVRRRLGMRTGARAKGGECAELGRQADHLRREIQRLGEAIVSAGEAPHALVRMMSEREKSLAGVEERRAALKEPPAVVDLDARRLEQEARERLADLQGLVHRHSEEARGALGALLREPLVFRA